jgi:aryl-phospho-beta-D-glucosidase BglC (GH1 family)
MKARPSLVKTRFQGSWGQITLGPAQVVLTTSWVRPFCLFFDRIFDARYSSGKGMNTFRIAFMMERISPLSSGLTGSFDSTYLNGLKTIVSYVTGKGGYAVLDPHNYARYNGAVITDTSAYVDRFSNGRTIH